MFKLLKQPIDLQVVSIIDVIDCAVVNTMEVSFMSNSLVCVLWNLEKDYVVQYDKVVELLIGFCSYNDNPC